MSSYNVQSLFIFFAIFSLLGGGVASLYFNRLDTSAKYWTVATILWGITGMATVFRDALPLLWSYSIPIGLSCSSFVLMGLGIVRLYKSGPQWPSLLALGLATVVYTLTLELCRIQAGPKVTLVLSGLGFGFSAIWCAYPAHVHFKLTGNRFSMHMRWVMAGLGVLHLVRLQGALTGWGVQTFGEDAWTLGIWSAIFVFGMLRYFTYIAMRIQQQNDERLQVVAAQAREEEARRLGSQLTRLERQQSLGVMSASFAHELNQPLTSLVNYAQLLQSHQRSGKLDDSSTHEVLDNMIASSLRASAIVQRIRSFVQPEVLKKERLDLRNVIDEVCALVAPEVRRQNIRVIKSSMPEPVWVQADAVQMSQVMFNVLRNAMESVASGPLREIGLDLTQRDQQVQLSVLDTGAGLSQEAALQAGDLFYTTKLEGLGMGLSITKTILAQYGGHLSLTSAPGHGACALICLPAAPAA